MELKFDRVSRPKWMRPPWPPPPHGPLPAAAHRPFGSLARSRGPDHRRHPPVHAKSRQSPNPPRLALRTKRSAAAVPEPARSRLWPSGLGPLPRRMRHLLLLCAAPLASVKCRHTGLTRAAAAVPALPQMIGITNREFEKLAQHGQNYLTWASDVKIVLGAKKLYAAIGIGGLHDAQPTPEENNQISGSFSAVRKALLLVSTCLQDNPRPDTSNIPTGRSFGPPGSGVGCPPGVDPHSQRSYLPPHMPDYHGSNYPSNVAASSPRFFVEQEIMFRMICLNDMVGSIIGKGGATIHALQSETGASIKVIDPVADSDERVIVISARENSDMMHSPAQDAVLRVHSIISEPSMDKSSAVPARLLVPSQHIGCLLGKGGSIIAEMRKVTGAGIRIFGNEQIPRCAQRNDELVQVTGSFQSIQDALLHITGRIRDVIIPPKPHPGGVMPPYPPVGNTPHHQSRQEPPPPHPSGGMPPYPMHPFRANLRMGPFDMADHRPPGPPQSHSMEHPGADRMSYSYRCEQGGPRPFLDQPSPRTWAPEAPNNEAPRNMPDMVPPMDFRKGAVARENQVATPTGRTTEVVIPCKYIGFICGTNGSDLAEIKKISGAAITVHDPKPGDTNATIIICGDPEQTKKAQSLIHAFIFCGLYQT